jgi:hypothetical protein
VTVFKESMATDSAELMLNDWRRELPTLMTRLVPLCEPTPGVTGALNGA